MSLVDHARSELAFLRGPDPEPDEMQDAIERCILDIVALFAEQGHSGSTAGYALALLEKLLAFEPVGPITGREDEWGEDCDGEGTQQNRRCSHVFRDGKTGIAYDIDAVVFQERGGCRFQNGVMSARRVSFPYVPASKVVPAWQKRPRYLLARLTRRARP